MQLAIGGRFCDHRSGIDLENHHLDIAGGRSTLYGRFDEPGHALIDDPLNLDDLDHPLRLCHGRHRRRHEEQNAERQPQEPDEGDSHPASVGTAPKSESGPGEIRGIVRPMPSILLVADDNWVRNDVAAAISGRDATVTVSDDPKQVASVAGDTRYDFVIVDMQVKSMGGMAVTRLVKDAIANGDVEPTPIIMLLDRQADVFLAKRAGASAYLVKPFTAQELRAALSTASV